jgi:hypothetical protein
LPRVTPQARATVIENVLTAHQVTGNGAWCSSGAAFLASLADAIPHYEKSVSIIVDHNEAGRT